jgi:muramoyltetrapeptide carboxypeptidase
MKKHIYIYSPSGAVRDKAAFKRGIARLKILGHEVEVDEDALASHQRFAGEDTTRLAAIHRAAASGADVALTTRGGYGLTRILSGIKYKAVAKSIDQGLLFVGLSDFSAFSLAVLAKTGRVTWAGPALGEGFGVGGSEGLLPDDIMEDCFNDLITGQGEGAGWRQAKESSAVPASKNAPISGANYSVLTGTRPIKDDYLLKNAVLWGGNLSVLCSLVGTPYLPPVKRGILFLEDVAEHPYRIERMLSQLLHSGILAHQKAIVLGQFTDYKLVPHDKGYKLQTVVNWLRSQLKIPVLTNLPFGHVQTKVLLPVGATVDLAVQGRDALLIWGHQT